MNSRRLTRNPLYDDGNKLSDHLARCALAIVAPRRGESSDGNFGSSAVLLTQLWHLNSVSAVLDGEIGRAGTFQDTVHIERRPTVIVSDIRPVGQQPAFDNVTSVLIDRRQTTLRCKLYYTFAQ
jgi:hypothetical protein